MKFLNQRNNQACSVIAAALIMLGGCEKKPNPDTAPPIEPKAKVAAPSSSASYEVIVQTRPDDLQKYLTPIKAGYDICVIGATQMKVPVKPFVTVPYDFIVERNTYISDGRSFYTNTESFSVDQGEMEAGCETSLGVHKIETTISDGFTYSVETDGNSPAVITPKEPHDSSYNKPHDYSDYNISKVVNGINLLCTKDIEALSALADQMCMVSDAGKVLVDSELEGIIGYMKIYSVKEIQGVLTIEPTSVKTGLAIDPKRFSMSGS